MKTERWEIYRDSAIPYIGKISKIDGSADVVFCCFIWTRWLNHDHAQLVKRSLLLCGIPVENCRDYVENEFSVLQWITLPTQIGDLPTGFAHEPSIETL